MAASSFGGVQSRWASIYFNEGNLAAMQYCERRAASLEPILERLDELQNRFPIGSELAERAARVANYYRGKQERYKPHRYGFSLDDPNGKRDGLVPIVRGRGEPGLTPFHWPDAAHRFHSKAALDRYLDQKIAVHEFQVQSMEDLMGALGKEELNFFTRFLCIFDESADPVKFLENLRGSHQKAIVKWKARKEDPHFFSKPLKVNPMEAIGFTQLHSDGLEGAGVEAIVMEGGVDVAHKELERFFSKESSLPASCSSAALSHGTHVAGIIAKSAPKCTLSVALDPPPIPLSGRIVNLSQEEQIPFLGLLASISDLHFLSYITTIISNDSTGQISQIYRMKDKRSQCKAVLEFHERVQEVKSEAKLGITYTAEALSEEGLLIQANGNDGVILDESLLWSKQAASTDHLRERMIRVVNLDQDGITPYWKATLPGKEYAEITVCAVGTDICSTLPGDIEGKMTGSSMAAPFVTGLAAILQGAFPNLTPSEIRTCILDGAIPILLGADTRPFLLSSPEDLKNYPSDLVKISQRLFGRGRANAQRSYAIAQRLSAEKLACS